MFQYVYPDSRCALPRAREGAGIQHASQIAIAGAILKQESDAVVYVIGWLLVGRPGRWSSWLASCGKAGSVVQLATRLTGMRICTGYAAPSCLKPPPNGTWSALRSMIPSV